MLLSANCLLLFVRCLLATFYSLVLLVTLLAVRCSLVSPRCSLQFSHCPFVFFHFFLTFSYNYVPYPLINFNVVLFWLHFEKQDDGYDQKYFLFTDWNLSMKICRLTQNFVVSRIFRLLNITLSSVIFTFIFIVFCSCSSSCSFLCTFKTLAFICFSLSFPYYFLHLIFTCSTVKWDNNMKLWNYFFTFL